MRSKLRASWSAWILTAVLVGVFAIPAQAALMGKVAGVVRDTEGKPVAGLVLNFFPEEGGLPRKLKTDKQGRFSHSFFPAGSYRVELAEGTGFLKSLHYVLRDSAGIEITNQQGDANPETGFPPLRVGPDEKAELTFVLASPEYQKQVAESLAIQEVSGDLKAVAAKYEAGDMEGVVAQTKQLLEKNPKLATAHYLQGMAYSRLGRLDQAAAALRAALDSAEQPGVDGALGTVLLQQGQALTAENRSEEAKARFEEARVYLKKELERTPDSLPLLTNYSTVLEHADPEGALPAVLAKLLEAEPDQRTRHLYRLAKWHFDLGETDKALEVAQQIPRSTPDGAMVAYSIAARLFNEGKTADAIKVANMGLEFDPNQPDIYRLLARAYLSENRNADAIGALKKFLELRPDDPDAAVERELLARLEAAKNP